MGKAETGKKKKKKTPWFNGEAKRSVRRKFFAYTRYREIGAYARYRIYVRERDKNKKVLRKARKTFEKKLYKEVKKNPKALYRYISAKKGNGTPITKLRKRNGMNTSNDREAAEELNEFFQSVFVKEEDKDIIAFNDFARLCFETEVAEPFDFKGKIAREVPREVRLDWGMVLKVLKNLDPNKTPGPDGMHPKVLMEVAEEIAEPVYMIYEESLLTSSIPDYWEVANITSIFKGGDRKDPGNYRPVSLTSVLCKGLGKLIRQKILDHIC